MLCPVCQREMEEGSLELQSGSRIGIFWSTVDRAKGVDAQGLPFIVSERLGKTSMLGGTIRIRGHRCRDCDAIALLLPQKDG